MDRRYRMLARGTALGLVLASAGCQGAFHRRGIPPEPRMRQDDAPAQFSSAPSPAGPNMGLAPTGPSGRGVPAGPYGNVGPYGAEPTQPLGEASGGIPGAGNPSPVTEPPGMLGSPAPQ